MPETRTLPISIEHREFTVKVGGEAVTRESQLLAVYVLKAINKISSARLVYLDGAASSSDFPLSNANTFIPGKEVEILAGADSNAVSIFKGIVIQQNLKVRDNSAPQLVVECRHQTVKLTVGRKNAYFFEQPDSDIISKLLENARINAVVDSTSVIHQQQVQYDSTDWDFLLTRAEANGKLVFTNSDRVIVKAPTFNSAPVCSLQFGSTIIEMDAAIDARLQYSAVKSFTWDASQQSVLTKEAADPELNSPGNLESNDLASVVALDHYQLQHIAVSEEEAQVWANAQWLKSQMSKVSGRVKCEGIATVNPGDMITLSGVGDRYNGNVFVTGVRQDFDLVQGWKTHIQFGNAEKWLAEETNVAAPKAAALLPGINGLQIGVVVSNEDPNGEHRVRVRMPLVNNQEDGTWARVAAVDAGNDRGFFFRPEVGDEVVLGFLNDDPRQAIVLGMLHSSAKAAPLEGTDANHEKVYQSRSKMKLYFNDEKKIMQLETPAGNKISLSEEDKSIKIEDQNGNKIAMTPNGIKIESSKAIELKAGTEVKIESGTSFRVKGGTDIKLQGTSGAEISSTATMKVKGSLVLIN
ncbi:MULTISPECIES: type VI secretion system tip protein VgrG [Nostoc]|uniref:Type VI secretion system tip protein VgrG n=2 Tax=Nostoc TaxID=1177 RepID=A0ABR8IG59_9NOSO|nr:MULTISPECIES: type VI secretion system tip protein VgrG [Nostoc]MBD2563974.1 type VI secretion system tip protein VgrG [Nostoc linckia FACHB-391]MBD2650438.1 type VI secretion system tip protein VgrG [Nostoc foliaceum FACHB-393]